MCSETFATDPDNVGDGRPRCVVEFENLTPGVGTLSAVYVNKPDAVGNGIDAPPSRCVVEFEKLNANVGTLPG